MSSVSANSSNKSGSSIADAIAAPYVCVGVLAICVNLLILIVLFSEKKLRAQSAFVFGVSCSHILLGLEIAITGVVRIVDKSNSLVPAIWCVRVVYPLFYPWALFSTALLLTLIGFERLTAIATPHWFRKWMSDRNTWYLVMVAFLAVMPSVGAGVWVASSQPATTHDCVQSSVFGKPLTTFGRAASALGGTAAVFLTISALVIGSRRIRKLPLLSGEAGKMKRQIQLTRAMLSVSITDFCLVVIPNSLSVMATLTGVSFVSSTHMIVAFSINAILSVFSYLIFNVPFRRAALRLLRGGGSAASTQVAPFW